MTYDPASEAAIHLLKDMISIPSVSRDEKGVADMLQTYMAQASGLEVSRHNNNLWLIAPGFDETRPSLLLNAHIDTVKAVSSWQHDPFSPTTETVTLPDGSTEQRLYGLGANDDGASLVALLHAFLCEIAPDSQAPSRSKTRPYNLIFLASAEEEVSGKNGIESVLPLLPPISAAVVGEPTEMQPAIAEKGLVVLDGLSVGKAGHAARNEGINAIYKALEAVRLLKDYRFEHESAQLGPVKISVTGIQAGTTHNQVPDTCTFMVDVRTTDAYSNEAVVETLQKLVEPYAQLTPRSTRLQPSGIAEGHPLLRRILDVCPNCRPFGSPTLSDQALMRFPSVKMGPGQSARSHTADEYIRPEEIRQAIEIYCNILNGLTL